MSILKIVAIVGAVLGILFCIMETRKTGKRYLGIFVALIVVSAALFAIAGMAEERFTALAAEKAQQPQPDAQALAARDVAQAVAQPAEANDDEYNMIDDTDEAGVVDTQVPEPPEQAVDEQVPESEPVAEAAADAQPVPDAVEDPSPEAAVADTDTPTGHGHGAARERRHGDAARNRANANANDEADEAVAEVPPAAENVPEPAANEDQNTDSVPLGIGKIVADAGPNIESAKLNEAIQFTAKQTRIPKGVTVHSYTWDFGDGEKAEGHDVKHAYSTMGKYTVSLTVTDTAGQSSVATKAVDVNRPENKIKLAFKALEDLQQVTQAPAAFVSMFEKTYAGTKINIDATGYILAEAGGKCELVVSIDGPNCVVSKNKILEDGGEGDVNVKASCKGDPGEYTWMVTRKVHKGICTFNSIKVDVSEN